VIPLLSALRVSAFEELKLTFALTFSSSSPFFRLSFLFVPPYLPMNRPRRRAGSEEAQDGRSQASSEIEGEGQRSSRQVERFPGHAARHSLPQYVPLLLPHLLMH
jgi:hypothetical protein